MTDLSPSPRASLREPFTEHPQLASRYGAISWRGEQSVIDILQNHLDANQRGGVVGLPRLAVRMSAEGSEKPRWVTIDRVGEFSKEWQITGLRVNDKGAGFDPGFLGLLGASTKSDDPLSRGGLGEGLKMCVVNLLRQGADVRLALVSRYSSWCAVAKSVDDELVFEGAKVTHRQAPKASGSVTEITVARDSDLSQMLTRALDTRIGEGIGALVLDYKGSACDVHRDGKVPGKGGDVYVKGLWIQQVNGLLFSYNLGERWAIHGRDRKTVKAECLDRTINHVVTNLNTRDEIKLILKSAVEGGAQREISMLTSEKASVLSDPHLWRETLRDLCELVDGKKVLASNNIDASQLAKARERGIEIINSHASGDFLRFIDALFPGETLTWTALQAQSDEFSSKSNKIEGQHAAEVAERLKESVTQRDDEQHSHVEAVNAPSVDVALELRVRLIKADILRHDQLHALWKLQIRGDGSSTNQPRLQSDASGMQLLLPVELTPDQTGKVISLLLCASTGSSSVTAASQEIANTLLEQNSPRELPVIPAPKVMGVDKDETVRMVQARRRAEAQEKFAAAVLADKVLSDSAWDVTELERCRKSLGERYANKLPVCVNGQFADVAGNSLAARSNYPVLPLTTSNERLGQRHIYSNFVVESIAATPSERFLDSRKPGARLMAHWKKSGIEFDGDRRHTASSPAPGEAQSISNGYIIVPFEPDKVAAYKVTTATVPPRVYLITAASDHGKLVTTVSSEDNGYYTEYIGRGDFSAGGDFHLKVGFGALEISVDASRSVSVEALPVNVESSGIIDSVERNRGKESIRSSLTLSYGAENWNTPIKALVDCLQNHLDANRGKRPTLRFTVRQESGVTREVSESDLRELSSEWEISAFAISDEGAGFPSHQLTLLGASTKTARDRGRYGEGLKLILNACTRHGVQMKVASRDWEATPIVQEEQLTNYETGKEELFSVLGFNMTWNDELKRGTETTVSLGAGSRTEFWNEMVTLVDPRKCDSDGFSGIDRFILSETPLAAGASVRLYRRKGIFEKGLRIEASNLESPFGYNFIAPLTTTRERNDFDIQAAARQVDGAAKSLLLCPEFARQAVIHLARKNETPVLEDPLGPGRRFSFNDGLKAATLLAFEGIFGERAILSVKPELERLKRVLSYPIISLDGDRSLDSTKERVATLRSVFPNEVHLADSFNIIQASRDYTLKDAGVLTTESAIKEFERRPIEIDRDAAEAALETIERADRTIIQRIQQLRSAGLLGTLAGGIDRYLPEYELEVARRSLADIGWRDEIWPNLGGYDANSAVPYIYNVLLLKDPRQLFAIHMHEVAHRITGLADYTDGFQQFLVLMGAHEILMSTTD